MLKSIISQEIGFEVKRSRFISGKYSFPIHIVIMTSEREWGWFDPHTYQIALNIKLMYGARDQVIKDILRHEMAHYVCHMLRVENEPPHGETFRRVCDQYGWGDEVKKASFNLDHQDLAYELERKDKLLAKIKNLLKLAQSDNPHEAELATLKANQLLLKHNLSHLDQNDWTLYSKTVMQASRRNAKMAAIYDILKHFLVGPVFIYGQNQVQLEVSGSLENIELAEYVAGFLEQELERLWKAQTTLKGMKAKNAFFLGIAKGYEQKMIEQEFSDAESRQLIVLKNQLDEKIKMAHRRLSSTSTAGGQDKNAFHAGKKSGQSLTVKQAVKNKSETYLLKESSS
tara:strand:+ start:6319 stop:7344 length:1026 start_codon:yes stop_codon:yes gene_type:complete